MSTDTNTFQDPDEYVREQLSEHREVLETLADLDTPLTEDAELALEILDEGGDQS